MAAPAKVAVIAGIGPGTGAAVAHAFSKRGYAVALLARSNESLQPVKDSITQSGGKAEGFPTDVADESSVTATFKKIAEKLPGAIEVGIFNASAGFVLKPFLDLSVQDLEKSFSVSATGAFIFAQAALREMVKNSKGSLIFTGATASLRGGAKFAAFAPAKFATRALSQSLAREFGPQGIHVAHVIIDGLIDTPSVKDRFGDGSGKGDRLDPDAIARAYTFLAEQDASAWTFELDLRPSQERF